jgi:hypothetical protein
MKGSRLTRALEGQMEPADYKCFVKEDASGRPFLAMEPRDHERGTAHIRLRAGATMDQAAVLAAQINALATGVTFETGDHAEPDAPAEPAMMVGPDKSTC